MFAGVRTVLSPSVLLVLTFEVTYALVLLLLHAFELILYQRQLLHESFGDAGQFHTQGVVFLHGVLQVLRHLVDVVSLQFGRLHFFVAHGAANRLECAALLVVFQISEFEDTIAMTGSMCHHDVPQHSCDHKLQICILMYVLYSLLPQSQDFLAASVAIDAVYLEPQDHPQVADSQPDLRHVQGLLVDWARHRALLPVLLRVLIAPAQQTAVADLSFGEVAGQTALRSARVRA